MVRRTAAAGLRSGLTTLSHLGVAGNLSDAQLLSRFLARGGEATEAAFEALVARHGPMVLHVCGTILRDPHDAQDAFQATFLVLASRAGSIRQRDDLAGWLLSVARRVAVRSRADLARRRAFEGRAAEARADRAADRPQSWPELHEEIGRLPQRYREPVVLCYLEGLSTDAAALRLGCPRGTVLSRLSRARERLRGRLIRRGLAPTAVLPAAGRSTSAAPVALPPGLVAATVRSALGFAAQPAAAVGLSSATVVGLARGVIQAMMVAKLKAVGAAVLAIGLTLGGFQTFARQFGGPGDGPNAPARQAELTRAVDRLESLLDESAGRNAAMRKALQDIRAGLIALRADQEPAVAKGTAGGPADVKAAEAARSAGRLADLLKRHPARLSRDAGYGSQIYMLDLEDGELTLIGDEPLPNQFANGMPVWSHDGRRILFETTGAQWPIARLILIEERDGRPTYKDLGPGNRPAFSPDDQQVAFSIYPDAEPGVESGVWMMNADGTGRRRVADFGAPSWSPDGRELLVNSYPVPTRSTLFNFETGEGREVKVAGHQIFSWPSWAGPETLVSALSAEGGGESIALLDVRKPEEAKIVEVLWKRGDDLNVAPRWPVYRPDTRQCFFAGEEPKKRSLYMFRRGDPNGARLLVVEEQRPGQAQHLSGMTFSPGGRYLIFTANRPERK